MLEKAFWSIFGVCVVSFYFLRFFPPKAILVDVGCSICVVHSIFFAFATSIRISRVGVPPGLELGLARTL